MFHRVNAFDKAVVNSYNIAANNWLIIMTWKLGRKKVRRQNCVFPRRKVIYDGTEVQFNLFIMGMNG
jgi:hypothetical protein